MLKKEAQKICENSKLENSKKAEKFACEEGESKSI